MKAPKNLSLTAWRARCEAAFTRAVIDCVCDIAGAANVAHAERNGYTVIDFRDARLARDWFAQVRVHAYAGHVDLLARAYVEPGTPDPDDLDPLTPAAWDQAVYSAEKARPDCVGREIGRFETVTPKQIAIEIVALAARFAAGQGTLGAAGFVLGGVGGTTPGFVHPDGRAVMRCAQGGWIAVRQGTMRGVRKPGAPAAARAADWI